MQTQTSLIAVSLLTIVLGISFQRISHSLHTLLKSTHSQEVLSAQGEYKNDKAPHRGSGRREFVEFISIPLPTA